MSNNFLSQLEHNLMNPEPDLSHLTAEEQFSRIREKVADFDDAIITKDDLITRIKESKETGKPLRVKLGIDPTGPDIHLGHLVPILMLRRFQRMSQHIELIVGDFTASIGDPSGRNDERPPLSREQIIENMKRYKEQAGKVLDVNAPSVTHHMNGDWINQLTMIDWVMITKEVSAIELLKREDFQKRWTKGHGLSMAELEYAIYMGYDSVHLQPDIEIGGIDQYLNMQMGRQMMAKRKQKPQMIICNDLLPGTTGERDEKGRLIKMSKSKGNYIAVLETPNNMYAETMGIPDETMWVWFRELTEITTVELNQLKSFVDDKTVDPKTAKELLARVIVGMLNDGDEEIINAVVKDFNFKHPPKGNSDTKLVPDSTETVQILPDEDLIDALQRHTQRTRRDLRGLADGGRIKVLNGEQYESLTQDDIFKKATDWIGSVVKIGKRYYCRLEA